MFLAFRIFSKVMDRSVGFIVPPTIFVSIDLRTKDWEYQLLGPFPFIPC